MYRAKHRRLLRLVAGLVVLRLLLRSRRRARERERSGRTARRMVFGLLVAGAIVTLARRARPRRGRDTGARKPRRRKRSRAGGDQLRGWIGG